MFKIRSLRISCLRSVGFARSAKFLRLQGLNFPAHFELAQYDTPVRLWELFLKIESIWTFWSQFEWPRKDHLALHWHFGTACIVPKVSICTFHTKLELPVSKICNTLRITATRHTYVIECRFYGILPLEH